MKSPVQRFRPELERVMHEARETQAGLSFDPVTVKSALTKAAGYGEAYCVIQTAYDLRETEPAQAIVAWCGKEGLRADWISRPGTSAHGEQAYDLVISWRSETATT